MSLRIVVAEDSLLMRDGLVNLLTRFGHRVVAEAADADELLEVVRDDVPDLIVTDVRMPPGRADDGLRAAVTLRSTHRGLPVLVLSQYVEQSYAARLLDSDGGHAVGYLLKDRIGAVTDFVAAAEKVATGGTVVDPEVIRQMLQRRHDPLSRISAREREVLALMAEGRSNAAVARALTVTEAAVNKHVSNIFTKLDLPVAPDDHRRVLAVLTYLRA
ncbi:DNA-binding NarL/FixJ family response regulator [Actinokineospora baliensis]|uniref:response regulator transcription factor n=1 Tax=Actinokineospora baliensis TaxID=547056 RepID=UPI00195E8515|nr:response regulator transcription factor [Actinokineospora baliensis]MBM7776036.1 DNA-binding NarL/FixJ family response regulator [Actinokineospora baliensis]